MGDRIAILREGGGLAQYDTPREILAAPADDFVAQFIGDDRALKRLGLTQARRDRVGPAERHATERRPVSAGHDRAERRLAAAEQGRPPPTVLDGDGDGDGQGGSARVAGLLTLETVSELLDERAAP